MNRLLLVFPIFFTVASLYSLFFWLFLSNLEGHSELVEKEIAEFVNLNYQKGDTVFSVPGWDIGYTKYLSSKIVSISHDLADYSSDELGEFESDRFIFVLDSSDKWKTISEKYNVNKIISKKTGNSFIVIAENKSEKIVPKIDFVSAMNNAKEAYLTDEKGNRENCDIAGSAKWICSKKDPWNSFEKTVGQMGGAARKAVWAHPKSKMNKRIVYLLPDDSSKMVLRTAFLPRAYSVEGDSVKVSVFADKQKILDYVNENVSKMFVHKIDIPKGSSEITLQFYTEKDGARHFVFNGYIQ